jgi:hypothetical protein
VYSHAHLCLCVFVCCVHACSACGSHMMYTVYNQLGFPMQVEINEYEGSELAALAAGTGRLACFKILWTPNYLLIDSAWDAAAKGGHLDILHYLHENSLVTRGMWAANTAAIHGHLDCLTFLLSVNPHWDYYIANDAAKAGQLECLAYLFEHGYPVGRMTCSAAAEEGRLDCLRYLHVRGCPWDSFTTSWAAWHGHLSCLKYAAEEGCPVGDDAFQWAIQACQSGCLEYLLRAGHRPKCALKLEKLENDNQLACLRLAESYGVRASPAQLVLSASLGSLKLVRVFHSEGYPLWNSTRDEFWAFLKDVTWERWANFVRRQSVLWGGVLCLPPSDENLRACWGTLRFGALRGAPLTPRAEALVRERRACAQEVLRCFHAARWRAVGRGPHAGKWAAMSRVPLEVLLTIMELAEVEIYEAAL